MARWKDLTPAEDELAEYMSELSESYLFAGWHIALEVYLWDAYNKKKTKGGVELTEVEWQKLHRLVDAAQCWIYWWDEHPKGTGYSGPQAMPLAAWEVKYAKEHP